MVLAPPTFTHELSLQAQGFARVAGVDEVGRGPLAGPVVAAALFLNVTKEYPGLQDSKLMSRSERQFWFAQLMEDPEVILGIGVIDAAEIDQINIRQATLKAMRQAVAQMRETPNYLLIDGRDEGFLSLPHRAIIQGDRLSLSIAAASVVAKEWRDCWMEEADRRWPLYGFARHKGYGTQEHREALAEHGPSPIHRLSFRGVSDLPQTQIAT